MPGLGFKGYCQIAKETTWGTKVVSSMESCEIMKEDVKILVEEKPVMGINTLRTPTKRVQGAKSVTGSVEWEVNAEDMIGYILKSVFPAETFTDSSPNGEVHLFKPQNTLFNGLTMQIGRDVDVTDHFGGMVDALTLSAKMGELIQAKAQLTFKDADRGATPQTPSYSTQNPLVYHTGTIKIDNVAAIIRVVDITFNSNLANKRQALGSNLIQIQTAGFYDVSGSLEMYWDSGATPNSEALIAKYLSGTGASLDFNFTGAAIGTGTRGLRIEIPQVFFNGETANLPGRDEILVKLPFRAVKLASDDYARLTLTNSHAAAY